MENLTELANRSFDWHLGGSTVGEIILKKLDKFEEIQQNLKSKGFFDVTFTTYFGMVGFIYSDVEYLSASYENFLEVK
jgi:hypothetical protein